MVTLIPLQRATRIRPSPDFRSKLSGSLLLVIALVVAGVVLVGSFAQVAADQSLHGGPSASSSPAVLSGRVPTLWPFSRDSIWNLPIGASAVYVPANIASVSAAGMTTDPDVLILTPSEPVTAVYYNSDAWSGQSRCTAEGGVLFQAPIPSAFVVPGATPSDTPNYATAILMADGHTLIQGQPMARCTANGTATMWWFMQNDLYGTGLYGGHGGSMLSSIGGTIRLGELVPGGLIRHAMKVNLDGAANLYYDGVTNGYRWPASQADSCASSCYHGTNPRLRMGSLLALPSSIDVAAMGLETAPALILAKAFQDYGAYVVDNTGWSVYGIETEFSPQGRIEDEFNTAWGFPINPSSTGVPWARDMARIFNALAVVDNWDAASWGAVSASNGTLGVGGGAPRVAWAPDFGPDTVPPVASVSLSGTMGDAAWYVSPVGVTLTATDLGSGVAAIHYRTDGGSWQLFSGAFTVQRDGSHTIDYYATDVAGNNETSRSVTFRIDTVPPSTTAQVTGTTAPDGSYVGSVTVTLTPTDATSGVQSEQYRIDGGPTRMYSAPFPVGGNGTHMLEYFATDVAGNSEGMRSQSFQITGDTHASPVSTLTATGTAGTNGWFVSPVTITLTAISQSGTATSISFRLDGGPWATYSQPFSLPDGRHVLEYLASDVAGYSEPSRSAAINVDFTPPTIQGMPVSGSIPPDGSISWSGSDGGSGIARYEVSVDGGPFQSVGLQTSLARHWSVGAHVVVVRAFDAAGNLASSALQFNVAEGAGTQPGTQPGVFPSIPPGTPEVVLGFALVTIGMLFRPHGRVRRPVPA